MSSQHAPISCVGIVAKTDSNEAPATLKLLQKELEGCRILIEEEGHHAFDKVPSGIDAVDAATFGREVELVVVLGGDGTLIHAASLLTDRVVPILGINLGYIGFLTAARSEELPAMVRRALNFSLPYVDRMRLDVAVQRGGRDLLTGRVLNDVVLNQTALARIASFRVELDKELVTTIRGDGIIVATPTGSTAYSMAAGGSILSPELEAVALTPICPHSLTQRPLVVPPNGIISVTLQSDTRVYATLDGQTGREIVMGDVVLVKRSPVPTRLLRAADQSHFSTLRAKLRWGQD